jgi:hypothetical protein
VYLAVHLEVELIEISSLKFFPRIDSLVFIALEEEVQMRVALRLKRYKDVKWTLIMYFSIVLETTLHVGSTMAGA